jgi:hypothetical protein
MTIVMNGDPSKNGAINIEKEFSGSILLPIDRVEIAAIDRWISVLS